MSPYNSFAIVGFGQVGSLLAKEFLQSQSESSLRILTRSSWVWKTQKDKPELKALSSKGVDVISVDYSSVPSIFNALKGVDVVFSALRDDGLHIQPNVIRAAKEANVKLYVPSEYGRNTLGDKSEYLKPKADAHDLLKELHLPYTLFFTGMWSELLLKDYFGPLLGVDFEAGKFRLFGDGRAPISWTSPRSFIPFVYHAITTLPPSQLENKVFEIEGDRKSFRDLIAMWEAKHGRRAEVAERSPEEIQKLLEEYSRPLFRFVKDAWTEPGGMLISGEANKLWPEWKPLKWEDLMP
ncbi:NAD-P-binding protein [Gautieria morchelliformis]|nr:NAD-P-binding protein [Gautieria morchelliformis]